MKPLIKIKDFSGGIDLRPNPYAAEHYVNFIPQGTSLRRRRGTLKMIDFDSGADASTVHPDRVVYWKGAFYAGSLNPDLTSTDAAPTRYNGAGLFKATRSKEGLWSWAPVSSAEFLAAYTAASADAENEATYNLRKLQHNPTAWDLGVVNDKLYATNGTAFPLVYDGKTIRQWGLPEPRTQPAAIDSPAFVQCALPDDARAISFDGKAYEWDNFNQWFKEDVGGLFARVPAGGKTLRYRYKTRARTKDSAGPLSPESDWVSPDGEMVDVYDVAPRTGGVPLYRFYSINSMSLGPDYPAHRQVRGIRFLGRCTQAEASSDTLTVRPEDIENFCVGQKINVWVPRRYGTEDDSYFERRWVDHEAGDVCSFEVLAVDPDALTVQVDESFQILYAEYLTLESDIISIDWRNGRLLYGLGSPAFPVDYVYPGAALKLTTRRGTRYVTVDHVVDKSVYFYPAFDWDTELPTGDAIFITDTVMTEDVPLASIEEITTHDHHTSGGDYDVFYIDTGKTKVLANTIQIYNDEGSGTDYPSLFLSPFFLSVQVLLYTAGDDTLDDYLQGNIFLYKSMGIVGTRITNDDFVPGLIGNDIVRLTETGEQYQLVAKHGMIERWPSVYEPAPVIQDRTGTAFSMGAVEDDIDAPRAFKYHVFDGQGTAWLWGIDQEPNLLYRTNAGNPEGFNALNFHRFDDPVVCVLAIPETTVALNYTFSILVFTSREIYGVSTAGAEAFRVWRVSDRHGCVGRRAALAHGGQVYFVADDGIYRLAGMEITPVSGGIEPLFRGEKALPPAALERMSLDYFRPDNQLFLRVRGASVFGSNGADTVLALDLDRQSWHPLRWDFEDGSVVKHECFDQVVEDSSGDAYGVRSRPYLLTGTHRNYGGLSKMDFDHLDDTKLELYEFTGLVRSDVLDLWVDFFNPVWGPEVLEAKWDEFVAAFLASHPEDLYTFNTETNEYELYEFPEAFPGADLPDLYYLYYEGTLTAYVPEEDGLPYPAQWESPEIDLDEPHMEKIFETLYVIGEPNRVGISLSFFVDGQTVGFGAPADDTVKSLKLLGSNNFLEVIKNSTSFINGPSGYWAQEFKLGFTPAGGRSRLSSLRIPLDWRYGPGDAHSVRIGLSAATDGTAMARVWDSKEEVYVYYSRPVMRPLVIHEIGLEFPAPPEKKERE